VRLACHQEESHEYVYSEYESWSLTLLSFAYEGKTSTIVAAAKRMYGGDKAYSSMTLELNASDARGIDVSCLLVCTRPAMPPKLT
jgi:hypothetical protein